MGKSRILASAAFVVLVSTSVVTAQSNAVQSQIGFGYSIEVSSGRVVVGEPLNQRVPGMAYVYERSAGGNWELSATLKASDGYLGDNFGASLTAEDDLVLVGAGGSEDKGGAIYSFQRDQDGRWHETGIVRPGDGRAGDGFGRAITYSDGRLFASNSPGEGIHAVYVFAVDNDSGAWEQEAVIVPPVEGNHSAFGTSLAAGGGMLFVGSPRDGAGAVLAYRLNEASQWAQAALLRGTRGDDSDTKPAAESFGTKLLLRGEQLFVTAPGADQFTGRVYSFIHTGDATFMRGPSVVPFDATSNHGFARSIALAGNELLVSAISPRNMAGAVYAMKLGKDGKDVLSAEKHYEPQSLPFTYYGESMAAEGDLAVVGANQDAFRSGTVYVYERDGLGGAWKPGLRLIAPPAIENPSIVGDKVECKDGAAGGYGCERVDLVSFLSSPDLGMERGILTNDLWGWTDAETGKEYAIVGRNDGTTFVDISDAANPVNLGFLPRTEGSPPTIWRDMKVYKDHVFIVSDNAGRHGVQIFDLRQLRDMTEIPALFAETARYDGIHSAHNIVINEKTGFAYTVGNSGGGETCGGGSHIINIQDPQNPTFVGCFAHTNTGRTGTGYTHDAQCVTYGGPDERYTGREICFGANETAISISDVTDKKNTIAIARGDYPNPGYTHQGWLSDDHRYFFVNDELDEINGTTDGTRTLIWDVAELDDPILVNEYVSTNKASDHNLYVRGQYMYQSNYVSGLRIVDVSNVEAPVEVGHFDTVPWGTDKPGFGGSWSNFPFFKSGLIIVTSAEEGLFILKRSEVGS